MSEQIKTALIIGYVSSFLGILSSIILQPLILNSIGKIEYVVWTMMVVLMGYLGNLFSGIKLYVTNQIARGNISYKCLLMKAKKTIAILSVVLLSAITLFYTQGIDFFGLYYSKLYTEEVRNITTISLALFLLKSWFEIGLSYYEGGQSAIASRSYDLALKIANSTALIVVIYYKLDLFYLALCYFSLQLFTSLLIPVFIWEKKFIVSVIGNKKRIKTKELLISSIPYLLISIPQNISASLTIVLAGKYLEVDQCISLIIYSKVFSSLIISQNIFMSIYAPRWARFVGNGELEKLKKNFRLSVLICFICCLALCTILFLFGERIISIWIGRDDIHISALELSIYTLNVFLFMFKSLMYFILNSLGVEKKDALIYWLELLLFLFFSSFLVFLFEAKGLLISGILSYLFTVSIIGIKINKIINRQLKSVWEISV